MVKLFGKSSSQFRHIFLCFCIIALVNITLTVAAPAVLCSTDALDVTDTFSGAITCPTYNAGDGKWTQDDNVCEQRVQTYIDNVPSIYGYCVDDNVVVATGCSPDLVNGDPYTIITSYACSTVTTYSVEDSPSSTCSAPIIIATTQQKRGTENFGTPVPTPVDVEGESCAISTCSACDTVSECTLTYTNGGGSHSHVFTTADNKCPSSVQADNACQCILKCTLTDLSEVGCLSNEAIADAAVWDYTPELTASCDDEIIPTLVTASKVCRYKFDPSTIINEGLCINPPTTSPELKSTITCDTVEPCSAEVAGRTVTINNPCKKVPKALCFANNSLTTPTTCPDVTGTDAAAFNTLHGTNSEWTTVAPTNVCESQTYQHLSTYKKCWDYTTNTFAVDPTACEAGFTNGLFTTTRTWTCTDVDVYEIDDGATCESIDVNKITTKYRDGDTAQSLAYEETTTVVASGVTGTCATTQCSACDTMSQCTLTYAVNGVDQTDVVFSGADVATKCQDVGTSCECVRKCGDDEVECSTIETTDAAVFAYAVTATNACGDEIVPTFVADATVCRYEYDLASPSPTQVAPDCPLFDFTTKKVAVVCDTTPTCSATFNGASFVINNPCNKPDEVLCFADDEATTPMTECPHQFTDEDDAFVALHGTGTKWIKTGPTDTCDVQNYEHTEVVESCWDYNTQAVKVGSCSGHTNDTPLVYTQSWTCTGTTTYSSPKCSTADSIDIVATTVFTRDADTNATPEEFTTTANLGAGDATDITCASTTCSACDVASVCTLSFTVDGDAETTTVSVPNECPIEPCECQTLCTDSDDAPVSCDAIATAISANDFKSITLFSFDVPENTPCEVSERVPSTFAPEFIGTAKCVYAGGSTFGTVSASDFSCFVGGNLVVPVDLSEKEVPLICDGESPNCTATIAGRDVTINNPCNLSEAVICSADIDATEPVLVPCPIPTLNYATLYGAETEWDVVGTDDVCDAEVTYRHKTLKSYCWDYNTESVKEGGCDGHINDSDVDVKKTWTCTSTPTYTIDESATTVCGTPAIMVTIVEKRDDFPTGQGEFPGSPTTYEEATDITCASTSCTKCGETGGCSVSFTADEVEQTLVISDIGLCAPVDNECDCLVFSCTDKNDSTIAPCPTEPVVDDVCIADTIGDRYDITCYYKEGDLTAADCNGQDATTAAITYSTCTDRFCIDPADEANYEVGETVDASAESMCDATFKRPTNTLCSTWTPATENPVRLVVCSANGIVITCPTGLEVDLDDGQPFPNDSSCVSICGHIEADTTATLGESISLDDYGLEECNNDSFRVKYCTPDSGNRNVYCATKSTVGGVTTYVLSTDTECSGDNYETLPAYDCKIGCHVNADTFATVVGTNDFETECDINSYRSTIAAPCGTPSVDASDTRTAVCYYQDADDDYHKVNDGTECTGFDIIQDAVWAEEDCTIWCYNIDDNDQIPATDGVIDTTDPLIVAECTADLFKPTTNDTPGCEPLPKSDYRVVVQSFEYKGDNINTGKKSPAAVAVDEEEWVADANCAIGYRCKVDTEATEFDDYYECDAVELAADLCGTICKEEVAMTSYQHCIQTVDWFGNVPTTVVTTTGCNAEDVQPYDCSCSTEDYCLTTAQTYPTDTPIVCTDNAFTTATTCGVLEQRQTFKKTKADTFISECDTGCDANIEFASTARVPLATTINTVCAPTIKCQSGTDPAVTCTATDTNGYPTCDEEVCDGTAQTRTASCYIGDDTLTEFQTSLETTIDEPTLETAYMDAITCPETTAYELSRTCNCAIAYWCLPDDSSVTENWSYDDVIKCNVAGTTPCINSCTEYRKEGLLCRAADGTFTEVTDVNETCGTDLLPQCPALDCRGDDFCAPYTSTGTITFDSDLCSEDAHWSDMCYEEPTVDVFDELDCTEGVEATTSFSLRQATCIKYYINDQDEKVALPNDIINDSTLCTTQPTTKKDSCEYFVGCNTGIIGPITVTPVDSNTVLDGQVHDYGTVSISWANYKGPNDNTIKVNIWYALATSQTPTATTLSWVPLTTDGILVDLSKEVTVPKIDRTIVPNGDIFFRVAVASSTEYFYSAITSVKEFIICQDLLCPMKTPGHFECYIGKDDQDRNESAVCRCSTAFPGVTWTDNTCTQSTQCTQLSTTTCKNNGYYEFSTTPTGTNYCAAKCTCPGGQTTNDCSVSECPADACNTKQGKASTDTTKCGCTSCFIGFSGSNCGSCSRLASIAIASPSDQMKTTFADATQFQSFATIVSKWVAELINVDESLVKVDVTKSSLNGALTLVIELSGDCPASTFTMLAESVDVIASRWNAVDISQTTPPAEVAAASSDGKIEKSQAVNVQTCAADNSCPSYVGTVCTTGSEDPTCQAINNPDTPDEKKSNSTTVIVAVVVSVGAVLIIAVVVIIIICCCGRESSGSGSGSNSSSEKAPKEKKSKQHKDLGQEHLELV